MPEVFPERDEVLSALLSDTALPAAVGVRPIVGRGFGGGVSAVDLADGRRAILRLFGQPQAAEWPRERFLQAHGIRAPRLLAATSNGSLHEFVEGTRLGDLIETGQDTPATWRSVGEAFRGPHAVRFPAGLEGDVLPDRLVLRPADPAERLRARLDRSMPGLQRRAPAALAHLPALQELVARAAPALRAAPTALGHGDIHMWNIIVSDEGAWLIDWEEPRVCDPALELALLDKHAALFNGRGTHPAFFEGYGSPVPEPNTSLHRVVQSVIWAASGDWDSFARKDLPDDLHRRTREWLAALLTYVADLPAHIDRLRALL